MIYFLVYIFLDPYFEASVAPVECNGTILNVSWIVDDYVLQNKNDWTIQVLICGALYSPFFFLSILNSPFFSTPSMRSHYLGELGNDIFVFFFDSRNRRVYLKNFFFPVRCHKISSFALHHLEARQCVALYSPVFSFPSTLNYPRFRSRS